ncbi:transcriptional regulator [Dinghuibacter silviterrae]|uniref:transcriptional regulator n=1 Tax=Dinghuibacter silviterrae TaxID=1539049 RepID=UPI0013C2F4EC|nr:tetratricopeptide repeat protein [Dinghuibacter silviterrae]
MFLIIGIGWGRPVKAQNKIIDSLRQVLAGGRLSVDGRIRTLGQLGKALSASNPQEGLALEQEALDLARDTGDPARMALVYSYFSQLYIAVDSLVPASRAIDSALFFAGRTEDKTVKGMVWYRKGLVEDYLDKVEESMRSFITALGFLEGQKEYATEAGIYYIMAGTYGSEGDLAGQARYARFCAQTALASGLPDNLCNGYQALASSFEFRYRKDTSDATLRDSCMYYNRVACILGVQNKDRLLAPSILAVITLNMSNLYAEFYPARYKDSAMHYLSLALDLGQETKQKSVVASCFGRLSDYAQDAGDNRRAETYLLEALAVVNSQKEVNSPLRLHIIHNLADLAEKRGDKAAALDFYKQYIDYYKAYFDAAQVTAAQKLDAQYQFGKTERDLLVAQQQAANNRKLKIVYIILFAASLTGLLFLFRSYHLHIRLHKEESARLLAEQQLLEARKEYLQKELLAGSLALEEKDGLLQSLQQKITEISDPRLKKVGRLITERTRLDEDFESLKQDFAHIHPEFIEKLQQKASGSLTRIDLKYCTYILMGLSNKEVGVRLGIEAKSIRMARYRIKQKLGLGKEESLDQFVRTLA